MTSTAQFYRHRYQIAIGKRKLLEDQLAESEKTLEDVKYLYENGTLLAQAVLQDIATKTQSKIRLRITNIVQIMVDAVFPYTYLFNIDFDPKRGKTEANLTLSKTGVPDSALDPMSSNGGGIVDILALALRISAYTLGRTRNVLWLDEPMKFVSRDLQEQAAAIIHHLSGKLDIQFIINTHIPEIIDLADRTFKVELNEGVSRVIAIKNEKRLQKPREIMHNGTGE